VLCTGRRGWTHLPRSTRLQLRRMVLRVRIEAGVCLVCCGLLPFHVCCGVTMVSPGRYVDCTAAQLLQALPREGCQVSCSVAVVKSMLWTELVNQLVSYS
jgi:hypothetical protein